jgi:23S rRNA G2445 N2-methylase RlmL
VDICRGTRYCTDITSSPTEFLERAIANSGELKFNFAITSAEADLEQLSEDIEQPPVAIMCSPHGGMRASSGSLLEMSNSKIKLCDLQYCDKSLTARLQNRTDVPQSLIIKTINSEQKITGLPPWKICNVKIVI